MATQEVKMSFDKEYKVRVLDSQKFEKAEATQQTTEQFTEKISSFNEKVETLVNVLEAHADRIDAQKLRVSQSPRPCASATVVTSFVEF
jgi:Intraflagellar transport complex B, subunit 20